MFSGEPPARCIALDGKTLQKLWGFNTGGGVSAPPMTFSVDGKQYIAILVGLGGAWDKWFIEFDARAEADAAGFDRSTSSPFKGSRRAEWLWSSPPATFPPTKKL